MQKTSKTWTGLGLSAAFASTLLVTACGNPSDGATDSAPLNVETPPPVPEADAAPASQGGEGEGGVAIEQALTDPVVYNAALAITEAHILAARDAYHAGETGPAAEMFAHPVSEVLFDMEPIFEARGVPLFDALLSETSVAALSGETHEQISARTDAIIAKLRDAATYAPDNGSDDTMIQARVISDQIDRAATMFRIAQETPEYEPYLDGYGFYVVAANQYAESQDAIRTADPDAANKIETALGLLAAAYPTALRPDSLSGDVSEITVAASNVLLAVYN